MVAEDRVKCICRLKIERNSWSFNEKKKAIGGTLSPIVEESDIASTQKNESRMEEARKR